MDGYQKLRNVAYGIVDIDVSDQTQLSIGASIDDLNRDGVRWGGLPAFYSDYSRTHFDRSDTVSEDWTYWNTQTNNYFVNLKHTFAHDISLNIAYNYQKVNSANALLYGGGTVDKATGIGEGSVYRYVNDYQSIEQGADAYLSVPFDFFGLKQELVLGYMYNQSKLDYSNWGMDYRTSSLTNPIINYYDIQIDNAELSIYDSELDTTTQSGLYLAGKLHLWTPLKVIAGLRLSNWKIQYDGSTADREFENELTPYMGVIYDIDTQHSIYASYTDIFQTQSVKDVNGNYLDPVVGKNYETGIKGEYFAGRLNAALSIFRIEQDGVAEAIDGVYVSGTTDTAYRSVDGVTSKGVEFEIDGQLNDDWNISFGIAYFKAYDQEGNAVATESNRTTANLFTTYRWDKLSLGGGINVKSKAYTYYRTTHLIEQKAYALVNLMAAYQLDKNIKVQLNVNNLLDKEYYSGIGGNTMTYGDPRNATLSLSYNF